MIQALAPRMPRGYSWVWLSIALAGGSSLSLEVEGQTVPKAKSAAKSEAPAEAKKEAAAEKKEEEGEGVPAEPEEKAPSQEMYKDPAAEKILARKFRAVPGVTPPTSLIRQVREMAGGGNVVRETLTKYVTGYAADLTNPSYVRALLDPQPTDNPNSAAAKGIRLAHDALVEPIDQARKAGYTPFLEAYGQELVKALAPLLENNLIARYEAIIILGQSGSPDAVDVFIKQLNDRNQTIWVKLWAARGITQILQTPTGGLDDTKLAGNKASAAAKALADFLNREKDAPWPVVYRALEALGSLRLSASPTAQSRVEMADAAARVLANPDARLEVRAEAAWALGMLRISTANKINYPLIGFHVAEVAAQLAEKVAAEFDDETVNIPRAERWTTALVYQIFPALYGQPGVRESGLMNMAGLGNARTVLGEEATLVKAGVRGAVELVRAPKGQRPTLVKDLNDRIGALRTFLGKNPPADFHLVPGGTELPLKAQVAGEAPADPAVARGPAGVR